MTQEWSSSNTDVLHTLRHNMIVMSIEMMIFLFVNRELTEDDLIYFWNNLSPTSVGSWAPLQLGCGLFRVVDVNHWMRMQWTAWVHVTCSEHQHDSTSAACTCIGFWMQLSLGFAVVKWFVHLARLSNAWNLKSDWFHSVCQQPSEHLLPDLWLSPSVRPSLWDNCTSFA